MLDARTHNYLAAWAEVRGEGALAWTDISTGDLNVMPCPAVRLGPELYRLSVREVLVRADMDVTRQDALVEAGAAGDAAGAGKLRFRLLRKAFGATVRGWASLDAFGSFWPGGDFRARRALRLSRAYAERVPAASAPAAPGQWLAADADRHGHAAQPRTDAQPGGRRPAGEPAGRSRPDGDGRRRASAGTARVRPRDRCRGDRPAA